MKSVNIEKPTKQTTIAVALVFSSAVIFQMLSMNAFAQDSTYDSTYDSIRALKKSCGQVSLNTPENEEYKPLRRPPGLVYNSDCLGPQFPGLGAGRTTLFLTNKKRVDNAMRYVGIAMEWKYFQDKIANKYLDEYSAYRSKRVDLGKTMEMNPGMLNEGVAFLELRDEWDITRMRLAEDLVDTGSAKNDNSYVAAKKLKNQALEIVQRLGKNEESDELNGLLEQIRSIGKAAQRELYENGRVEEIENTYGDLYPGIL